MKLRKCCGKTPKIIKCSTGITDRYLISCKKCKRSLLITNKLEIAIKEWNKGEK